jgi:hypothetical protein
LRLSIIILCSAGTMAHVERRCGADGIRASRVEAHPFRALKIVSGFFCALSLAGICPKRIASAAPLDSAPRSRHAFAACRLRHRATCYFVCAMHGLFHASDYLQRSIVSIVYGRMSMFTIDKKIRRQTARPRYCHAFDRTARVPVSRFE